MDLVTPVMTIDIGTMVPDDPLECSRVNRIIKESTSYIKSFLFPQFNIFAEDVAKLKQFKDLTHQPLRVDECLTYLTKDIEYRIPIETFNNNAGESYIFFDSFYYCIFDKNGFDCAETDKIERFMILRRKTISDVHTKMALKHNLTINDRHIIIFTNFFITLRNKPFEIWELIGDEYGNVKLVK